MYIPQISLNHRVFEVWRSPNRFTKNPDIIQLKNGRMLLVYSDTDAHWSQKNQILTILASDDEGKNWFKQCEIDESDLEKGQERLVTPRLSLLKDGRLVVICDHDDDTHFHEDQSPGNWLYWSNDNGYSWERKEENGIKGFEPDRIINLPDGTLGVASQLMIGQSQEFAEILWVSEDNGHKWNKRSTIAYDGYHRFCEGAIIIVDGDGSLACVMRENHSGGIPCFVTFSDDCGHTWTDPEILPFAFHRPYAKQISQNKVFVTGRNVNGGLGCYGWFGDLKKEVSTYSVGSPRRKFAASLNQDHLLIENKLNHECRYTLYPPESNFSEVKFEAEVKVSASKNTDVAFMSISKIGVIVFLAPNGISVTRGISKISCNIDLSDYRTVVLHHKSGWMRVIVDGDLVLNRCIFREEMPANDFHGGNPYRRTQFGQYNSSGKSFWRKIKYKVYNKNLKNHFWDWDVKNGEWPDQYQRERLIQIHGNHPDQEPWPDHGYSSWIKLDDGRIFLVDYTNYGDVASTSHLVGVHINPEDLRN